MNNNEIIFMVDESMEGGYEAKAFDYSIYTQAETLDGLKKEIIDVVKCHFKDDEMPYIIRMHLVKDEVISV
ncbi:MAG: 2-oxoisovalerate dehydrogenase [Planctomycetota bacterium]